MKRLFFVFVLYFCGNFAFSQTVDKNLGIIPAPNAVKITDGYFQFSRESGIIFETKEDAKIAYLFHDFLKSTYSLDIPVAKNFVKAPKGTIRFSSSGYTGKNPEGYSISVKPENIVVLGKGSGLFYGFQSLMQMLPLDKVAAPKMQCAEIQDEPRYAYRGMMLDVCRHFMPATFVKKYIDLLAQYKINTFHWHLTDDQGWRIEIKKYPKLTQVGAFRAQTLIGNYHDRMPQWFDGIPHGGYYTQEEVKDIVAYATSKFVSIIPEIEMPGHSLAALASYPELACGDNPGPFKVGEKWGVFDDVYCAGKENTFKFLQDVLTEVIPLFSSKYIHIGGDECPKTKWKTCVYCQKRIKDNNLKDEHELQSYFVQRMEKFLNSKGKQIIGWDEILEGGLAPNATVMSWRGTKGGIAAAMQNHDAIMTPSNFLYFDHAEGKTNQEPVSIGSYTPLSETYSYNPTPTDITAEQQKRIIGVQANLWTEYIKTSTKVEYMILPRMMALAEIAWTNPVNKNWINFSQQRIPNQLARLDKTTTLYHVPTAINAKDTTYLGASYVLDLKSPITGARIFYTINGYTPREIDDLYEKPVTITIPTGEARTVKTIVITPSGKRSAITTTVITNFAPQEALTINPTQVGLNYYYVPGNFEVVSEIDTVKTTEKGIATSISSSKFRSKARTFGLVYSGFIKLDSDGVYTFTAQSDGGSRIWIDDKLVVDNDGKHAIFNETAGINLLKGYHKIEIRYFQAVGDGTLKIMMANDMEQPIDIPTKLLFH